MNVVGRYQAAIDADPDVPIIRITRDFDASVAELMRAHTDPEVFVRWVGPDGLVTETIVWDATTGGCWRYVSRRGVESFGFHGSFHEVGIDRIVLILRVTSSPTSPSPRVAATSRRPLW